MMTCGVLPGPYRVPGAYRAVCHFRLTNKTPAATYRAPGRFETTFVRERLMDAIAHKLRLDRSKCAGATLSPSTKCRSSARSRRSARKSISIPATITALLDKVLDACRLGEAASASWPSAARDGEMVGVGLAMFVEKAGLGPTDGVRIQVDTSGAVEVITGGASIGQGFETVMAQVCAEALGADYQQDARHPRPDRPHRVRHRRARLARHGDDRHRRRTSRR